LGKIAMENPFLTPPQIESEKSRSWALGFIFGFQGPAQSSMAQGDVGAEDADAFDQGVLAGQDAAINGLELQNACLDMNVEGPSAFEIATTVPEALASLGEFFVKKAAAGGVLSAVIFLFELSIALETFSDPPNQTISEGANTIQGQLQQMGFSEAMVLFVGGGIDLSARGCEMKLTSVFRNQVDAETAARAIGREHWLVASWRTDQSGGARIAASG
jgi:hypothetical protein